MSVLGQSPQPSAQLVRKGSKSKRRTRRVSEREETTTHVLQYYCSFPDAACGSIRDAETLISISQHAGAEVRLAETPSCVPGRTSYVIRGGRTEIEAAFQLMCQKTALPATIASQAQEFWVEWMKHAYPDLDSQAYFQPAVFVRRVPMTRQDLAGHGVLVPDEGITISDASRKAPGGQPPPVYGSDVRDDEAMERVFVSLKRLAQEHHEVFMCVTQLQFAEYLSLPAFAPAAAHLPLPTCLPPSIPPKWRRGDFDVLIIHRQYGLVVCEVKAFGGNIKELGMSQEDMDKQIRRKLSKACYQLQKAEAVLSHLVSDFAPGLRITKGIALPNMTSFRVLQALKDDPKLSQNLCQCLGAKDSADITRFCLCSDQLPASAPLSGSMFEMVWRVWDWWHGRVAGTKQEHSLTQLWRWWQGAVPDALPEYWRQLPSWWRRATRREAESQHKDQVWGWWQECVAAGGPDPVMTSTLYETLVARFCGPATTVSIPCTTPPRLSMKTRGHAVSVTGERYTADVALFPEQVDLLHQAPARVFLAGPPGTGKTVVLLLMATEWLVLDKLVCVVSTWDSSRVACRMLHHLLLQEADRLATGRLQYLQHDLTDRTGVKRAVSDLAEKAVDDSLHVIADDAGPDYWQDSQPFPEFCEELLKRVPNLRLWAASCQHRHVPGGWDKASFSRSLRCPPVVVREVAQAPHMARYDIVTQYSRRGVPDHTDGPPIKWIFHRGLEHPGLQPIDCARCGEEVACFLCSLSIGASSSIPGSDVTSTSCGTAPDGSCPPGLQYKDVLLLCWGSHRQAPGMARSLARAGIPVQVMRGEDDEKDVATARSDVMWLAQGDRVRGVERKVVVAVGHNVPRLSGIYHRLDWISRCTSQLVWVVPLPSDVDVSCFSKQYCVLGAAI